MRCFLSFSLFVVAIIAFHIENELTSLTDYIEEQFELDKVRSKRRADMRDDDDDDADDDDYNNGMNQCESNYTGGYSFDDQNCPCGKYTQGSCKSGVIIPMWTSAKIDEYIELWANDVAYNITYKNQIDLQNQFTNMYYIGEPKELFPEVFDCIAKCQLSGINIGIDNSELEYYCECKCKLQETKIEYIKELGVPYKGLLSTSEIASRGLAYALILIYFFMGVAIVADRFMDSIEMITSQEREVTIKTPGEEPQIISVRVWNETVSNLTLMALGSSAPEILLAVVETFGNGMKAGVLGPSTIVGSAAFNLFMIISLCMYVIPDGEARKIKHLRVFFVTATWSILAYVWLYFIVVANSKEIVEPWEALVTLLFFPLLTLWAWVADKRLLMYDYVYKNYQRKGKLIKESEGNELKVDDNSKGSQYQGSQYQGSLYQGSQYQGSQYKGSQTELDTENLLNNSPGPERSENKSRAYYTMQATRNMTGQKGVEKSSDAKPQSTELPIISADIELDPTVTHIQFKPKDYRVMEGCGNVILSVVRNGPEIDRTCFIDYTTKDGTASATSDFGYTEGTLTFNPGETVHTVSIPIIDDDVFELDEYFFVVLSNLRVLDDGQALEARGGIAPKYEVGKVKTATVTILDDDHRGNFGFGETSLSVQESCGHLEIPVIRNTGARGCVHVPFRTVPVSADKDIDFESAEGELIFDDEETEQIIVINVIDREEYEKKKSFKIELGEPRVSVADKDFYNMLENKSGVLTEEQMDIAKQGCPHVSEDSKEIEITLTASLAFKAAVDKIVEMTNRKKEESEESSRGPWAEQFADAVTVSAGDDDDDAKPSVFDYISHYLNLPWKLIFAFIPPTDYLGGSLCFVISIGGIGVLTAFIGDFASHFGCTVGVTDAITAISFVALGTSVPDTFASKLAAINDDTADASIGNVTGSNAVNVFLGIGIPWTFAAFYWQARGKAGLEVKAGTLTFAVSLFCFEAFIAILVLMARRRYGGELGGPRRLKIISSLFFIFLWVFYLSMSIAKAYCHI